MNASIIYLFFTLTLLSSSEETEGAARRYVADKLTASHATESDCEDQVCWLVVSEAELPAVRSRIGQLGKGHARMLALPGWLAHDFLVADDLDLGRAHTLTD